VYIVYILCMVNFIVSVCKSACVCMCVCMYVYVYVCVYVYRFVANIANLLRAMKSAEHAQLIVVKLCKKYNGAHITFEMKMCKYMFVFSADISVYV